MDEYKSKRNDENINEEESEESEEILNDMKSEPAIAAKKSLTVDSVEISMFSSLFKEV